MMLKGVPINNANCTIIIINPPITEITIPKPIISPQKNRNECGISDMVWSPFFKDSFGQDQSPGLVEP